MIFLGNIRPILLFLFFSGTVFGKEYPMLHYTIENGLPSNTVYNVCRDKRGNLWFGTDKGVARFNGLTFEAFTTYDGLSDNEVFTISEDYSGRLWMSTYNGHLCYYKDGRFYSGANTEFLRFPLKTPMGVGINLEKDSSVICNFADHTFFVNIKGNRLSYYSLSKINAQFRNEQILNVSKRGLNEFEILYNNKSVYIDSSQNIISSKKVATTYKYIELLEDKLYATRNGVYDSSGNLIQKLPSGFWQNRIINHLYRRQGNIFISTSNGLFINDNSVLLEKMSVSQVKEDGNGNYVICTLNNGIFILNKSFKATAYYKDAYDGIARYATTQNDNLYIGTHNKSLFRLQNGVATCLFNSSAYINSKTNSPTYKNGYLLVDNNYFAFGQSDNFIITNIHKKPVVRLFRSKRISAVNDIIFLKPTVYLVCRPIIFSIDYKKLLYPTEPEFQNIFSKEVTHNRIFAKSVSDKGEVWCSRGDSMYRLVNGVPIVQEQFKNVALREFIICGNYMVGYTHSNNLLICKNFEHNIEVDSIKTENCIWDKIYKLDDRRIIISTNNLYRIITLNPVIQKPGYTIETLDNPFLPLLAEYIYSTGKVCYFMKDGDITAIQMAEVIRKVSPPIVTLTSFSTKQKEYSIDSLIHITHSEAKYIILTFATPSFYKNIYCEYAISKNNEPDVWLTALGRDISLYNLGYGTYKIKLRVRSASGQYSLPAVIELSVGKPFWATWWFITSGAVIAGLLLRYRIKLALIKKEKAHQGEIKFLRLEYKALNVLMNPHFIFNAMNSVQSLINTNNKASASEYLRTFSDLIRQNMHNMSSELISLEQEINLVRNYLKLEKLRFDDHLNFEIEISASVELDDILIPPLIIQPLAENAVKHGLFHKQSTDNLIVIHIYRKDKLLYIEVRDNGIGLNEAKNLKTHQHQSYGIENIKKRIANLKLMQNHHISLEIDEMKDENGLVLGTKAVVTIKET